MEIETRSYESGVNAHWTGRGDEKFEFTRHIFETVREPLLALKGDLRIWLANNSFYKTFGVAPSETEGRHIYELGNGQWNIPQLRKLLEEIIPANETFNDFEVDHVFERIGRKSMLLNARRISDDQLILLAFEDVTERRRMESDLTHFAEIASHDLKEPLRMVTTFLGLLERKANRHDKDSNEYLEYAIDGSKRMATLIENLLAYSSAGRQPKVDPVDLNLTFHSVLDNLRSSIEESGAEVTKDKLPVVTADSTEFVQVFQNLISNSIKYKGTNSPKIHVSAVRKGGNWLFCVKDNGLGIAAIDKERVFNVFQRLHSKREYPGTGLGLSTCKKIVESHGGRIWVEPSEGNGSSFFFTIPVEN